MGRILGGILGVFVTSAMLALALPPSQFNALGWACLVPLLVCVRGRGFGQGFIAAVAACMLAGWWTIIGWPYTQHAFANDQERMAGESTWHLLAFFLFALVVGVVAGVFAEQKRFTIWTPIGLAFLGIAIESATQVVLPVHLGLTQYRSMPMVHLASYVGLWGVSFLVWLTNAGLACAVASKWDEKPTKSIHVWTAVAVAIWLWAWFGEYPLPGMSAPTVDRSAEEGKRKLGVAALQTRSGDLDELIAMSRGADAWLTVWPELSGMGSAPAGDTSRLVSAVTEFDRRIATSFEDDAKPLPHNTLSIISPSGESNRYWKRRLFGGERDMHQPGNRPAIAVVDGIGVGLNICFDSCFGTLIRDTALLDSRKADLIVLPSMGPESPNGFIQAVHGAFTPFRSAETGLPIVRSETSACAMITNSQGRIVAYALPGEQGALMERVLMVKSDTVYLRIGDVVLYSCWAGTGFWIVATLLRRSKNAAQ